MTTHDVLQQLAGMPDFLEASARRLSPEKALEPGKDGGFSFLEQVWHLADLERRGYGERIGRIRSEERPALADFDGAREAREGRYRERSLSQGLAEFRRARGENLALLRSVEEGEWARPATQEGVGELRLQDVPRMMAEHDGSHRGEIRELLGEASGDARSGSRAMAPALMLLLAVPLLGCPYDSPFPLGSPADTPRDERLIGQWHCVSGWEDKAFTATITPFEARQYSIVMTMPGEEKPLTCRGHVSSLKGSSVLDVQGVEDGKPEAKWMFVRYLVPTPSSVVFEIAEDDLLKEDRPQTAASLQAALEGPRRDDIFQPYYACARAIEGKK